MCILTVAMRLYGVLLGIGFYTAIIGVFMVLLSLRYTKLRKYGMWLILGGLLLLLAGFTLCSRQPMIHGAHHMH